ncbi:MAG TPA: TonB-dependent receptor [Holophagaceae bacterium]|jgi:outer membrane receptor protein involved in Fe transport|nr:TonB-dependent receptor [Holophagaceae bacterium]
MASRRLFSLLPLAACSAISMSLAAQSTGVTTGDLKGLVRDGGGKAVAQAKVSLSDDATGLTRSVLADGNGAFAFRLLTPGAYTLTVEAPGFSTKKISSVGVRLASTQAVNVDMQAVEASATVEVVGQNSVVDPTRTQVSNTIDTNQITNLPINRRDFTSFSLTTPLVAQDNGPASQGGAATGSGLSFLGQNSRANNIMVDGLDNNDVSVGSTRTTFSQDAIQEFVVVANGFSAEYGRAAGGALNIVTKSGGNDFTGDAFMFYRSGKWDAKRPFAGQETPFTQRQFGATVSGPLIKDTLFYVVSVERYDTDDVNISNFTPAFAQAVNAASGYTITPGAQSWNESYTTGLIKLDWYASAASHWTFRYNAAKEDNGSQLGWGGLTDITAGGTRTITDQAFSLANLWTPSGTFVNDFRILGSKRDHDLESLDPTLGPSITMAGQATFGTQRFLPQVRTEKDYELFDAATWFAGKHTLKLGADLMQTKVSGSLPLQFAGVYRFQAFGPFTSALQAMQAPNPYGGFGLPVAFIQGFGKDSLDIKAGYYSAFFQDNWQITDRFSLNLGLRYDKEDLPAFHDVADYDALAAGGPTQLGSGSINPIPGGTGATGPGGGPYNFNALFQHSNDWSSSRVSPRLSFNWQATDITRFYGGYGVFSGRTQLGPFGAVFLNNGTDMQTIVQVLQADPSDPTAPWRTWANAAGNTNRRYQSNPGGIKSILLPGHSEMPETKQSNLGMEVAPLSNLKFTLDFVYAKGSNFLTVHDVNALVPNPDFGVIPGALPTRRPDTRYSSVIRYDSTGESKYRAGTVGMQWQLRDTVALNFSYTYSKSEDNYTDWVTDYEPVNTFDSNASANWGPSNQDQRNRFQVSGVLSSKNWQNAFFRNWTASFIGRFASGRPYTILTGVDNDYGTLGGQNFGNGDGGASPSDRPVGVGRNSETLPSNSNMDIRLARKFPMGKKGGVEVMLDVFNVFNHYSQTNIQNVIAAPGYGTPVTTSADHNRELQLGVRFSW